jgi:hypothetical protein
MSNTDVAPKPPFAQPQAATPVAKPSAPTLKPVAAPEKKAGRPKGVKNKPKAAKAAKGAKTAVIGQVIADVLSCVEGLSPADKAKVLKIVSRI